MPITKPTSLNLKWWKANDPKSLPVNRELEALIERAEAGPPDVAVPKLEAKILSGKVMVLKDFIAEITTDHPELILQLKRTKVLLTKAKHLEFAAAIDHLIAVATADMARFQQAAAKSAKAQSDDHAKESAIWTKIANKWDGRVAKQDKIRKAILEVYKKSQAIAADAALGTKEKAADLAQQIGRNRFIRAELDMIVKSLAEDSAEAIKAVKADPSLDEAKDVGNLIDKNRPLFMTLHKDAEVLDKALVAVCVGTLGDTLGKKIFAAAPSVKVAL